MSPQSLSPSQIHPAGIQRPVLLHLNSSSSHATHQSQHAPTLPLNTAYTPFQYGLYPRDAMLAQVLAKVLCPCVSVRLSVTSRSSIETAELIELAFGTGTSSQPYYTALKGNSGTSFWNFVPNSELYFALALWRHVINLAQRVIN